ncbi:hypothetical protein HPB47_016865 [Ixodes persulcatus]|uniref:Uncharacterized protein n=1 Tax=Ixodes persulcatus TaxID=34615 RepID=A0AC60QPS5_IXOPE|nr:hypothetical protein HPB47_016865 [Ixodes persulcatus]
MQSPLIRDSEEDSDYDVELSSSSDEAEDDDDPDRAIADARQWSKIDMNCGTMSHLAVLGQLLQLAQQQFLQLVLLLEFTLWELVWIMLDPYRPLMLLFQQRIL